MSETLAAVARLVAGGRYRVSNHAYQEMVKDDIMPSVIVNGLETARTVEDYPDANRGPSILVLCKDEDYAAFACGLGHSQTTTRHSRSYHRLPPESHSVVCRFSDEDQEMMPERIEKTIKHIHEGKYVADVEVDLHYDDTAWSPTLMPDDVQKLERVQLALRRGDIKAAAKEAKVFELLPLAEE